MIYESIKGTLSYISAEFITVESGEIGYRIHIPLHLYSESLQVGNTIVLFLSQIIREDSQKLYGFLQRNERDIFEKLLQVSGIGAKTALILIGRMQLSDLTYAIKSQDSKSLSTIPGIGKKTAERIIIELADKMHLWTPTESISKTFSEKDRTTSDAMSALMNLGYSLAQSKKALQKALLHTDKKPELSTLISSALKEL